MGAGEKVILVTGASRGIGRAAARRFAAAGCRVAVHYRQDGAAADETLASLAGTMRRRGMGTEAIAAALLRENASRCAPPLPDEEVNRIARSVSRYQPEDTSITIAPRKEIAQDWPAEIEVEAYHGIAGDLVRTIEPQSEADPVAVLVQILLAFGNVIGRSARFPVEADHHHTNEFAVFAGVSSKGRKGTSLGQALRPLSLIDEAWTDTRVAKGGLSSGEGLIWQVRDPICRMERNRKTREMEEVLTDAGVEDKRLLVVEPEFASVLRVMHREGNTLSPVIRNAWDRGDLQTLTKNSPAKATGAHTSVAAA